MEQDAYRDAEKYRGEQFKRGVSHVSKWNKGAKSAPRTRREARVTKNGKVSEERGPALAAVLCHLTATSAFLVCVASRLSS